MRGIKISEVEGMVRIATHNSIVKMVCDVGEEFMEETWIFNVVKNH